MAAHAGGRRKGGQFLAEEITLVNPEPAGGSSQCRPSPQHMCFGRIPQRHPAADGQNEFAIAHVIGKLAHLGWISLRAHARNLH